MTGKGEVKRKPKAGRWWRRTITVIAILMILVGAYGSYRRTLKERVQARVDDIRAAGYPVTRDELEASYAYPPSGQPNAAILYLRAAGSVRFPAAGEYRPISGMGRLPGPTEPLSPQMLEALEVQLAENPEAIQLAYEAAGLEHVRYPEAFVEGLPDHGPRLRALTSLLCEMAVFHGELGDSEKAVEALWAALRVSDSLADEPVLISMLIRVACRAVTIGVTNRVVHRVALTDEQLVRLIDAFAQSEQPASFTRVLAGDRCLYHLGFEGPATKMPVSWNSGSPPTDLLLHGYRALGLMAIDHGSYLDLMTQYVELSKLPMHEAVPEVKKVDQAVSSLSWARAAATKEFLELQGKTFVIYAMDIGRVRTARAALAVERYRLAHGKMPNALDVMAPGFIDEVPIDPFDGKPLRYRTLEEGFVIYSVAEDGVDNGGGAANAAGETFGPGVDISFTIAR